MQVHQVHFEFPLIYQSKPCTERFSQQKCDVLVYQRKRPLLMYPSTRYTCRYISVHAAGDEADWSQMTRNVTRN